MIGDLAVWMDLQADSRWLRARHCVRSGSSWLSTTVSELSADCAVRKLRQVIFCGSATITILSTIRGCRLSPELAETVSHVERQLAATGHCSHPIRRRGRIQAVDLATGELARLGHYDRA
jgi:hypothetical protein